MLDISHRLLVSVWPQIHAKWSWLDYIWASSLCVVVMLLLFLYCSDFHYVSIYYYCYYIACDSCVYWCIEFYYSCCNCSTSVWLSGIPVWQDELPPPLMFVMGTTKVLLALLLYYRNYFHLKFLLLACCYLCLCQLCHGSLTVFDWFG